MPRNNYFGVEILIGGVPVPEYLHDDKHYVLCDLESPFTYMETSCTSQKGEIEIQKVPVTPYSVRVTSFKWDADIGFEVIVDGYSVDRCVIERLKPGDSGYQSRIFNGVRSREGTKQFLFSLPSFESVHRADHPDKVGTITVLAFIGFYTGAVVGERPEVAQLSHATKADVFRVTKGQFTMSTTCAGPIIEKDHPNQFFRIFQHLSCFSSVTIYYRMANTLRMMGILPPGHVEPQVPSLSKEHKRKRNDLIQGTGDCFVLSSDSEDEVENEKRLCRVDEKRVRLTRFETELQNSIRQIVANEIQKYLISSAFVVKKEPVAVKTEPGL